MPDRAYAVIKLKDSYGYPATRRFQFRSVSDAMGAKGIAKAKKIADALGKMTRCAVVDVKISVKRDVDFKATTAEAGSTVSTTASLKAQIAGGGEHTFNIPDPQKKYVDQNSGRLKVRNGLVVDTVFKQFTEEFDNGKGIFSVQGDFTVSDGEQLQENGLLYGFLNVKTGGGKPNN